VVPAYRRFYEPERLAPPAWSARPGLWARAFEVAAGPPPPHRPCFIHRDYHPGNTLWLGGRLVGVVDWVGGSWGPPSIDLGHMRLNLVWDLGPEAADRFLAAHHALTGLDHDPWWDVVAAVDCIPELDAPGPPEPWLARMEDWVAAALAGLDWPPDPAALGAGLERLAWWVWDDGMPGTGWILRLAATDPAEGWTAALDATDRS